jgi:hypothetical protein
MTLDELVEKLEDLQARGHGKVIVVVHDGMDPSELSSVQDVDTGTANFYSRSEVAYKTRPCIKITS